MKNNYLLVHGSFSSPFSNWIPWLRSELEKDIDKAKSMGLGIILVKSKDYLEHQDFYKEKYKNLEDRYDYNYFDGIYRKEQFEEKRRQF